MPTLHRIPWHLARFYITPATNSLFHSVSFYPSISFVLCLCYYWNRNWTSKSIPPLLAMNCQKSPPCSRSLCLALSLSRSLFTALSFPLLHTPLISSSPCRSSTPNPFHHLFVFIFTSNVEVDSCQQSHKSDETHYWLSTIFINIWLNLSPFSVHPLNLTLSASFFLVSVSPPLFLTHFPLLLLLLSFS